MDLCTSSVSDLINIVNWVIIRSPCAADNTLDDQLSVITIFAPQRKERLPRNALLEIASCINGATWIVSGLQEQANVAHAGEHVCLLQATAVVSAFVLEPL